MGTRGLYGFRKNGVDKTTYNHYDSYPDGLGMTVAEFCKNTTEEEMNKIYDGIEMVSKRSIPTERQIAFCVENGTADTGVSSGRYDEWYVLLRAAQGDFTKLRDMIRRCGKAYMIDDRDFIKDSLWCEYAYIINLDTHKLEFWKGFQKFPQAGNRYGCDAADGGYYPCALIARIPFEEVRAMGPEKVVEFMNCRASVEE